MAVEEDDGGRSPALLVCEACGLQCKEARVFAVHQERHRPVDPPTLDPETKRIISYRCPEGCGRNFITLTRYRDHVPACDGGKPIEPFIKLLPTGYREGFLICPECTEPFKDPEKLCFHLERHREVRGVVRHKKTGEVLSRPCPKGCGRHFPHWKEYEEHKRLCRGQAPLPNKYEAAAAPKKMNGNHLKRKGSGMHRCEPCARDFTKAGPFSIHMKKKHGKAYQAPVSEASEEPAQADIDDDASEETGSMLSNLRDKSRDLRRKADRLEEIVNKIERLFKEADDLV